MTDKRTTMVACPSCNGEREVETGDWFMCRETGAQSPITAPCEECAGSGGVEIELEPIALSDLDALTPPPTRDGRDG